MNHHVPPVGQAAGLGVGRRRNKVGASDSTSAEEAVQVMTNEVFVELPAISPAVIAVYCVHLRTIRLLAKAARIFALGVNVCWLPIRVGSFFCSVTHHRWVLAVSN